MQIFTAMSKRTSCQIICENLRNLRDINGEFTLK